MLVRAKRTHYNKGLRQAGEQFEHSGPLHEHIEPVKPASERSNAKASKAEQAAKAEDVKTAADSAQAEGAAESETSEAK